MSSQTPRNPRRTVAIVVIAATLFGLSFVRNRSSAKDIPTAPEKQAAPKAVYKNTLTPIKDPQPLLADYPEFVQPVAEVRRFEAPAIIDEKGADLEVRAWRFSYN